MVSVKVSTIFFVVFTITELQGASGVDVRDAPRPETGRPISKRSIRQILQILPWVRNGLSRLSKANGTDSGFSRLFGQRAAAEAHNVSRRSIGEHSNLDPVVEKVERIFRTLPSGGLFSHSHAPVFTLSGMMTPLANPQQTIIYVHSSGPLSLRRPAVPTPASLSPPPAPATPVVVKSDDKLVVVVNSTLSPLAGEAILLPAAPEGIPVAATIAPLAVPAIADESIIAAVDAALSLTTPEPTSAPIESARDDIQFISDQSSIS